MVQKSNEETEEKNWIFGKAMSRHNDSLKEGCWEPYSKSIEDNYFCHFLSMPEANRYLLTIVALNDRYNAMIVSR